MKKRIFLVVTFALGILIYLIYSNAAFVPANLKYFSLIDDGQSILNADTLSNCFLSGECSGVKEILVEKEFGRFRPLYWILQYINYSVFQLEPVLHHQFRIFAVGLALTILVYLNLRKHNVNPIISIISSAVLYLNYSFAENIIRLGPTEPYFVIIMGIIPLFIDWNSITKQRITMGVIFMIAAQLIKETAFIFAIPIVLGILLSKGNFNFKIRHSIYVLTVSAIVLLTGRIVASPPPGSIAYSSMYEIGSIFGNFSGQLNALMLSTSPLLKSLILASLGLLFIPMLRRNTNFKALVFWGLTTVVVFVILVPWSFVLERYLLPVLFAFAILFGLAVDAYLKSIGKLNRKWYIKILLYLSLTLALSHMFTSYFGLQYPKSRNYANWYSQYTMFEYDQVAVINKYLISGKNVLINANESLDTWEVLYEIPLHLKYIFDTNTQPDRLTSTVIDDKTVIFHRTPFAHEYSLDEIPDLRLVEDKVYKIRQIDPLKFRNEFALKPASTILSPPYLENSLEYKWEIYD